jgi:hypothetical protein
MAFFGTAERLPCLSPSNTRVGYLANDPASPHKHCLPTPEVSNPDECDIHGTIELFGHSTTELEMHRN